VRIGNWNLQHKELVSSKQQGESREWAPGADRCLEIGGVEGTLGAFEGPEARARDGWGMNSVAPHTREIPGERSICLGLSHFIALAPWSGTGPRLWEGPSQDCDGMGYFLPNCPSHQERMQHHASVRSI